MAKRAGVGRGTVSRVLNNLGSVSESARRKVLQAARELHYSVDPVGRSLKRRRTYSIGVLVDTLRGHVYPHILEGVERRLRQRQYYMSISASENSVHGEPLSAPLTSLHRVEGLIIVYHGFADDSFGIMDTFPPTLPIVTTGYAADAKGVLSLAVGNERASYELTSLLAKSGRRSICTVTGPPGHSETEARLRGYYHALEDHGLRCAGSLKRDGDWSAQSGYESTKAILALVPSADAIVAQNDWMAIGAIRAVEERGRRVPDDVAVVGFNDVAFASFSRPALTTARYPASELGSACAEYVIRWIESGLRPGVDREIEKRLSPRIIIRDSCGTRKGHPAR